MQAELTWVPFQTLLKKEVRRFCRVLGQTLIVPLMNTFLYLLIFGISLGEHITAFKDFSYLVFLIPGLLMMGVINNSFQNSSSSLGTSRFHGDIEDLRILPLSDNQILWGYGLAGLVRGLFVGSVTFIVGVAFVRWVEGEWISFSHPFTLLFFLCLGGLTFSFLGVAIGLRAKNIDQLSAVSGFVLLPLIYLGGVFFSLENLHPFWKLVSKVNPILYFINGVRYGFLGVSDVSPLVAGMFCVASFIFIYILALICVRKSSFSRW